MSDEKERHVEQVYAGPPSSPDEKYLELAKHFLEKHRVVVGPPWTDEDRLNLAHALEQAAENFLDDSLEIRRPRSSRDYVEKKEHL